MSLSIPSKRREYMERYRDDLLENTMKFWFPRSWDGKHGGFFTSFSRDGTLLQTDKSVWFQGRTAWTLANLYNTVEKNPFWLDLARSGLDFMDKYCFDTDGRMFFSVTQDGRPLRKRRYVFSETFAVIARAAYAAATGEKESLVRAFKLFKDILAWTSTPGLLPAKVDPNVRPMKGLAMPMILIATAQELRKASSFMPKDDLVEEVVAETTSVIDDRIAEIERDFMKPEFSCLLETVSSDGGLIDNFEGRCVNPGHSLEAGWFILEEARLRSGEPRLVELGTRIVDWSYRIGWDPVHGGIFYFRDCKGLPCTEYWHDMKFWWPHNEAIIATISAWRLTSDAKYADWHEQVHDWAHARFPDPVFGEWFGYLLRDGSVSTDLKGNLWKGPFHLPRMQWYCWKRLEETL